MRPLPPWPALDGAAALLPTEIRYERGVWGKAHGAPTDYRWLAATPGFTDAPTPERELKLGPEDHPRRATLWLSRDGVHHAVALHPSRAMDASGRRGFVEKQVARWRSGDTALPPALGALLLLPEVEGWDDTAWWDRKEGRPWNDATFRLRLEPGDHPSLPATAEAVGAAVERGVKALRDRLPERTLVDLYGALLDGGAPVVLGGRPEPLPAAALAALLLPLPAARAARLSLAGWVPSGRFEPAALAGGWDLLCTDRTAPLPPCRDALRERAQRLAEALLEGAPERLARRRPQTALPWPPEGMADGASGSPQWSPEPPPPPPTAPPAPPSWRPAPLLELADPGEDAPAAVRHLHRFARDPARRWIDLDGLDRDRRSPQSPRPASPGPAPRPTVPEGRGAGADAPRWSGAGTGTAPTEPGEGAGRGGGAGSAGRWLAALRRWPHQVEAGKPPYAHPEQWARKVMLVREAASRLAARFEPPPPPPPPPFGSR